jgi:hypothetical protein
LIESLRFFLERTLPHCAAAVNLVVCRHFVGHACDGFAQYAGASETEGKYVHKIVNKLLTKDKFFLTFFMYT